MELERFDSRADDMDADDSPSRDKRGGGDDSDLEEGEAKETRSKDRKKSSGRREEKDYRSKERDRDVREDKVTSRGRRKEERDDREREKRKDYREERDKHRDRDRKDRGKERERGEVEKERVKERSIREKEREKERDRGKEKERDKYREKDIGRDAEKEADSRDKERVSRKGDHRQEHDERNIDDKPDNGATGHDQRSESASSERRVSTTELQERILKAKEERTKKKTEGASELLDWVSKSRKIEEKKNAEKEKAAQLLRMFEEQENMGQEDSEDEEVAPPTVDHLAGVKVLHGLDKVVEGGAVILTLKDQNILADGDINEEVDMLENVEIGEQKRRDDSYKAAKKKTGIYTDKFNDDPDAEKKMLPQYDEPTVDEGVTLDARGRLTAEAEKKLEELRKRLQGAPSNNRSEDLTATAKVSLDYYTQEEMVQFKKPKKKKSSMRRKEKLNLDALEAEAVAAGLGVGDLGSRNDRKRQAIREEEERSEAERKKNAYQSAFAKAEEASKSLRMQLDTVKEDDEENTIVDDEDLYKSLERARKLALKKQNEQRVSGPEAVARLAATVLSTQAADNGTSGEQQEDKIIITEMEEFVGGLQLDEEFRRPDREDVFMDEDEAPVSDDEQKDEDGGLSEDQETTNNEAPAAADKEDVIPDETIHEAAVGKGLSGALKLLQDRGALKESVEWGGRNMDKKKSKLVGLTDAEGGREVRIERTDEFGRTLTPKEAFRLLSHKFHGKGPGKMKQEKRMKQYYEDLKLKQMKNADTPSLSAERMREAQAQLKTPYLVLSGHVKPGQNSDPRSGFATVEKDTGSLTPMLGDRKVEHFLGIKRKPESSSLGSVKKPKN